MFLPSSCPRSSLQMKVTLLLSIRQSPVHSLRLRPQAPYSLWPSLNSSGREHRLRRAIYLARSRDSIPREILLRPFDRRMKQGIKRVSNSPRAHGQRVQESGRAGLSHSRLEAPAHRVSKSLRFETGSCRRESVIFPCVLSILSGFGTLQSDQKLLFLVCAHPFSSSFTGVRQSPKHIIR